MTTYFFTDTATATLTYTGEGTPLTDANDVPSGAETVTRSGHWADFFDTSEHDEGTSSTPSTDGSSMEFLQFEATVAQPITQPYFYDGELQWFRKTEDELKQAQPMLDNTPWTLGHPPHDSVTDAAQVRGFWEDPRWNDGQQATLNVPANDPEAIQYAIDNDEVSIGFRGELDWVDDTDDYDAVQRNMVYDHVASVESGRCPPDEGCGLHTDDAQDHGHVFKDAVRTTMTQEAEGEPADDPQFSQGDWVEWDWSGGTGYGKVIERSTSETLSVEGGSREGTPEEPAYKLLHWKDDQWGNMVVKSESELRAWSDPPSDTPEMPSTDSTEDLIDTLAGCSPGGCRCGLHADCTASHATLIDAEVEGKDIDLVPPEAAQNAAQDALDARDDEDTEVNGMNEHGWSRAEQLASGEALSPSNIVGGTGAMAPWWSRHASHTLSDGEELSLKGSDEDNPWSDNSYTAGKGWGGVAGFEWAIRKGNEIHRLRGKEEPYDMSVDHSPLSLRVTLDGYHAADSTFVDSSYESTQSQSVSQTGKFTDGSYGGISWSGTMGGDLDESEIPNDDYEDHYVFDAEEKSESSFPLVDAEGNLRRENVIAAASYSEDAPDESELMDVLAEVNDEFDDPPLDAETLTDSSLRAELPAPLAKQTVLPDSHMPETISEFIDEQNMEAEDVIDELDLSVPDEPHAFYDGEPSVEDLADDFDAVAALQHDKEEMETAIDDLREEVREHRAEEFADKAERLAELVDSYEVDELVESFEDGDMTIDEIKEKVEVAEGAVSTTTTTTDSGGSGSEDGDGSTGADRVLTDADDVRELSHGTYDLSDKR